ncbi:hypothetical protein T484DRAFT_1825711 [Baffinella frigidus]|nr:hypothetical protein T484DRAFT_1825711 [Cryptophyta sp. CCMP2293]
MVRGSEGRKSGEKVEVAYVGCTGVAISGGSYASLAPSRNVMRECDVHHVARTCRTYTPPLFWSGVGHLFKDHHRTLGTVLL